MDWKRIAETICVIISEKRANNEIRSDVIRDGIFEILEQCCTVVYYPINGEKTRGFRVKRLVNDELEDFVYINTGKPFAEQVFAAAHELGHIWGVAQQVWSALNYSYEMSQDDEEDITSRFAAELLMPKNLFINEFQVHHMEYRNSDGTISAVVLARIIAALMNDFLVPYVAVRKRLAETGLVDKKTEQVLLDMEDQMIEIVDYFCDDRNTFMGKGTDVKTIPGIRNLLEKYEKSANKDVVLLRKIKRDFGIKAAPEAVNKDANLKFNIEEMRDE